MNIGLDNMKDEKEELASESSKKREKTRRGSFGEEIRKRELEPWS